MTFLFSGEERYEPPLRSSVACPLSLCLSLVTPTVAQTSTSTASTLPGLVRFGGAVKDLNGNPLTGVVGVTFALYGEQIGGAPQTNALVLGSIATMNGCTSPCTSTSVGIGTAAPSFTLDVEAPAGHRRPA